MKTPKEWLDWLARETNDPQQKGRTHEVLITEEAIAAIQQDAFESGRAAQMRATAAILMPDLPLTAQSLRSHADHIEPPPQEK